MRKNKWKKGSGSSAERLYARWNAGYHTYVSEFMGGMPEGVWVLRQLYMGCMGSIRILRPNKKPGGFTQIYANTFIPERALIAPHVIAVKVPCIPRRKSFIFSDKAG